MTVRPVYLLLLAPLAGCMRPNSASIEMHEICFPPDAGACSFASTCSSGTMTEQFVDLSLIGTNRPQIPIEALNQLVNNADSSGHVNTNDAFVQQAEISYEFGGLAVGSVTTDLQQTVPAGGTTVLGVYFMSDQSLADFQAGVPTGSVGGTMSIKLKGILGDRSSFETGSYRVPLTVCRGCLATSYTCPSTTPVLDKVCIQYGQWPATWTCKAP